MADTRVRLRFWGVRGSTPTPQVENLTFGGNTSCVEMRTAANESIILDAGSGIRNLGQLLMKESAGNPIDVKLFLTHFHWDHIQGMPFFAPIYGPKNKVSFYTGVQGRPLQETLEGQMAKPYFPVDFDQVAAQREFNIIEPDGYLETNGVKVIPFPLNHPQNATGYRIEVDGAVIVYATDYEHGHAKLDDTLREHAQDADILICDAQYTPARIRVEKGLGTQHVAECRLVARDAGSGSYFCFITIRRTTISR